MRITHAELSGATPGIERFAKDGTRQKAVVKEASGRKYCVTVVVCCARLSINSPSRTPTISCSGSCWGVRSLCLGLGKSGLLVDGAGALPLVLG